MTSGPVLIQSVQALLVIALSRFEPDSDNMAFDMAQGQIVDSTGAKSL